MGHLEKLKAIESARAQLGVGQFATPAEIRDNWKRLAGELKHQLQQAEAKLSALNEAYETLQPGGSVRVLNPTNDFEPIPVQRPISKQPEELSHVRPTMLSRVISREVNPDIDSNFALRTPEEDEQIAKNVRDILNFQ